MREKSLNVSNNKNIIYDTQKELYLKSRGKLKHHHLYQKVFDENNIRYAIDQISRNPGRNTPGPDGMTFKSLMEMPYEEVARLVCATLRSRQERYVREVEIPKDNGKTRKLGISNILDRIAQQCVLNILEPIVEPYFYRNSYGFRRNLSTKHCVSRITTTISAMKYEKWIYDCDLSNFFGTVQLDIVLNLLRENFGIKDGNFLKLIKNLMWLNTKKRNKIIQYEGVGLAQGTILGPVLANVQFDDFERKIQRMEMNFKEKDYTTTHLYRNHNTKERYIEWRSKAYPGKYNITMFRYADDFILLSNNPYDLEHVIGVFQNWCQSNGLSINKEKTRITHGYDVQFNFLGYNIKAGNNGLLISIKNYKQVKKDIGRLIKSCVKTGDLLKLNNALNGLYYYYDIATNMNDLSRYIGKVLFKLSKRNRNNLAAVKWLKGHDEYLVTNNQTLKTLKVNLWELRKQTSKSTSIYCKDISYWEPIPIDNYRLTEWCEKLIASRQSFTNARIIGFILSKAKVQKTEPVLGINLLDIDPDEIDIHHKIPVQYGGTDDFNNLVFLHRRVHKAIHSKLECEAKWNKKNYDGFITKIENSKQKKVKIKTSNRLR